MPGSSTQLHGRHNMIWTEHQTNIHYDTIEVERRNTKAKHDIINVVEQSFSISQDHALLIQ
uniref:Uncharacterized protein n=1 Tax=Arundo donax TaxID=35708 RepID=A0A0A9CFB4_ARUDO